MALAVCAGLAGVDYIGQVARYPEPERREELTSFSMQGGGAAANVACALATLGVPTAFAGKVSDDEFGDFARLGLSALGVDVSRVVVEPNRVTPWSFVAVERGARRTTFWTRGDVAPLAASEVSATLLDGAKLLVVDGYQPDAQLFLARAARDRGLEVIFDAAQPSPHAEALCRVATVVLAGEAFAAEVAGAVDRALKALRALGPRCAVVTLGEDGAVGVEGDGDPIISAAHPAQPVDTTGAGDVFTAAFAMGLLDGLPLRRRLELANCAAALSTRALGARAALPRREELAAALGG